MDTATVRFDEVVRVRQDGGWGYRNYWPRQTVFSFTSAGKYFPYVAAPGWPAIHDGLAVTALLEVPEDWNSLLGWVNLETGEIAGPNPAEFLKQAGVTFAWLSIAVIMVVLAAQRGSIMAFVGVLFSGYCVFAIHSSLRDWGKAKVTLDALAGLADDLSHNRAFQASGQYPSGHQAP